MLKQWSMKSCALKPKSQKPARLNFFPFNCSQEIYFLGGAVLRDTGVGQVLRRGRTSVLQDPCPLPLSPPTPSGNCWLCFSDSQGSGDTDALCPHCPQSWHSALRLSSSETWPCWLSDSKGSSCRKVRRSLERADPSPSWPFPPCPICHSYVSEERPFPALVLTRIGVQWGGHLASGPWWEGRGCQRSTWEMHEEEGMSFSTLTLPWFCPCVTLDQADASGTVAETVETKQKAATYIPWSRGHSGQQKGWLPRSWDCKLTALTFSRVCTNCSTGMEPLSKGFKTLQSGMSSLARFLFLPLVGGAGLGGG